MTALVIDGAATARALRQKIAGQIEAIKQAGGLSPGLAVVLVGVDPASQVYVKNKAKACEDVGIISFSHHLPADTTQADLLNLIARLNSDQTVHGILVQLPLPAHIESQSVIEAISPAKDVDCFHPVNVGKLASGLPGFLPCTPQGCMILLQQTFAALDNANFQEGTNYLAGKRAVVIGRSNIVGKPVAALLLRADCTVTIAHSRTRNLTDECRNADILIAAIGKPEFVKAEFIKKGAVIIDVGVNRIAAEAGKTRLVGDVAYAESAPLAAAITPVPGGVGPMTIACLLQNTLQACQAFAKM